MKFDYTLDYKTLDLLAHPDAVQFGVGEQGVLLVEPYKSEILPHWRWGCHGSMGQRDVADNPLCSALCQ